MNITYDQLSKIKTNLESNRNVYLDLWQWAATFSGSLNTIRDSVQIGETFKGGESQPSDEHSALDPTTLNIFDTVSQFYSSLFFPENNPFQAKPIEEADKTTKELYDKINQEMYRNLRLKETNFQDAKERSYNDYVILGTKALMALENPNPDFPFWVSNYSVQNMAFNPNRDVFLLGYQWTADQIVDQLVGDDETLFAKLPDDIRSAYNNYDYETTYDVQVIIMKNRDYKKKALGKNGFAYIGFWLVSNVSEIIKTDYYKEQPISESLYKVKTGEIYGRSPLTDRKQGFEIYDGVLYMITQNIGKIGDPATGYFDVGAVGFEYDTTPGSMSPFNLGLLSGQSPTFKIQDAGDITPAVSYLQPRLYEALRTAYGVDAMVDLLAQKRQMTATEVLTIENLRNKILAPRIRREVSELLPFKRRLFLLTARWLNRNGKISDAELAIVEDTSNWDISENSSVERIIQSENISQYQSELNVVAASMAVQPSIATAIDLYDPLQSVLKNGFIQLKDKKTYSAELKTQQQLALLNSLPKQENVPAQETE